MSGYTDKRPASLEELRAAASRREIEELVAALEILCSFGRKPLDERVLIATRLYLAAADFFGFVVRTGEPDSEIPK